MTHCRDVHVRRIGSGRRLAAERRAVRHVVHPQFKQESATNLPICAGGVTSRFPPPASPRAPSASLSVPCSASATTCSRSWASASASSATRDSVALCWVPCILVQEPITCVGNGAPSMRVQERTVATVAHATSVGVCGGPRSLTDSLRHPPSRAFHAVSDRDSSRAKLYRRTHFGRTQNVFHR
jgi:hypothetical protein